MDADRITPWVEGVALHPDVLSEHFSEDIFALDLGPLADGNPQNEGRCGFVDLYLGQGWSPRSRRADGAIGTLS